MDWQASSDGNQTSEIAVDISMEICGLSIEGRYSITSQHSVPSSADPETEMFENLHPKLAQSVALMEVTNPDVLRVTEAFRAFEHCAIALRHSDRNFFHKSRASDQISAFWSHSWHGLRWSKIVTLIVFYNSFPAMVLSFLTVGVALLLYGLGLLPSFERGAFGVEYSTWSICSGMLVACLVFLLWRPHTRVFLDRICISQDDRQLKAQAIFSLAGLLKKSKTMLILWDPSWTQRLWCLFELSAFLKSRQNQEQVLLVRPILFGPLSIAIFLTAFALSLPLTTVPVDASGAKPGDLSILAIPVGGAMFLASAVGYFAVSAVRSYFRDLDVMKQQLLSISFDRTLSFCCQHDHKDPFGKPLLCDRKIVKECVNIWFGSQEAFEEVVRSEVLEILMHDLNERVFTTAWALSVTSPILWAFMDLSISFMVYIADEGVVDNEGPAYALEGLALWLFAVPNLKDVLLWICRATRFTQQGRWLEILWNLASLSLILLQVLLVLAWYLFCRFPDIPRLAAASAFAAGIMLLSAGYCMLFKCLKKMN